MPVRIPLGDVEAGYRLRVTYESVYANSGELTREGKVDEVEVHDGSPIGFFFAVDDNGTFWLDNQGEVQDSNGRKIGTDAVFERIEDPNALIAQMSLGELDQSELYLSRLTEQLATTMRKDWGIDARTKMPENEDDLEYKLRTARSLLEDVERALNEERDYR